MKRWFHPSLEGAQHGFRTLEQFLRFAKDSGCVGAQPSIYHLFKTNGCLMSAQEIKDAFEAVDLRIDGISAHCIYWVLGTAWTKSKTILPFLPATLRRASTEAIENWAADTLKRFHDLIAELKLAGIPMFLGVLFGWEVATGYGWGFWVNNVVEGGVLVADDPATYNLIQEGWDRSDRIMLPIMEHATANGIYLFHETHPGTAAMTSGDLMKIVIRYPKILLGSNEDPSHAVEGEPWLGTV